MVEHVKIGSRLTTDLQVMLGGKPYVITGISHPATDQMAVTKNIPAKTFQKWMEEHANYGPVAGGFVFVIPEEHDLKPKPKTFGSQPTLDELTTDPEESKLAEKGVDLESFNTDPTLFTNVPDPIPTPPETEKHDTPAPVPQPPPPPAGPPAEIPATDPETFSPELPQDHPRQDQDLSAKPTA